MGACTEFAAHFEQGKYVERNMELVSALFVKQLAAISATQTCRYEDCCNKGEGACCARKGEYYAKVPEAAMSISCWWKHANARELFEKGCEAGDSRSCGALSELLSTKVPSFYLRVRRLKGIGRLAFGTKLVQRNRSLRQLPLQRQTASVLCDRTAFGASTNVAYRG